MIKLGLKKNKEMHFERKKIRKRLKIRKIKRRNLDTMLLDFWNGVIEIKKLEKMKWVKKKKIRNIKIENLDTMWYKF